eukprot:196063_1
MKLLDLSHISIFMYLSQVSALTNELLTVANDKLTTATATGWNFPAYYLNYGQQGLTGTYWGPLEVITDFSETGGAFITGVKCDYTDNPLTVSFSDDGIVWDTYDEVINDATNIFNINPTNTQYAKMHWSATGPEERFPQGGYGLHAQFVGIIASNNPSATPTDASTKIPTGNPSTAPTESPTYKTCTPQHLDWNILNTGDPSESSQVSLPIVSSSWDAETLQLDIGITLDYITRSKYTFLDQYDNDRGITYVIDTQPFLSDGRLLSSPNNCE